MADGWWNDNGAIDNSLAAYQGIGIADYATSKVNLFNPGTYNLVKGGTVDTDFSTLIGWDFTANTMWLKSNANVVVGENHSFTVRLTTPSSWVADTPQAFGVNNPGAGTWSLIQPRNSYNANRIYGTVRYGGSTTSAISTSALSYSTNYVLAMTHDGTTIRLYLNGLEIKNAGGRAGLSITKYLFISGEENTSQRLTGFSVQAAVAHTDTLTPTEVATLSAAMAALPVASGATKKFLFKKYVSGEGDPS